MDGKNLWNLRFVCWNNMSLLGHALKHACVISWSLVPSFEMRISFWVSENFVHQMLYWSILCQRLFHVHFAFRVLCFCKKCTLKKMRFLLQSHQLFRALATVGPPGSQDNRYVTSFHWSITQFTPASKPDIDPGNLAAWLAKSPGPWEDLSHEKRVQVSAVGWSL